jgi:hypothetical protein
MEDKEEIKRRKLEKKKLKELAKERKRRKKIMNNS